MGTLHLDAEQTAAVEHEGGPCIVASGPGSGKTRIVTMRVERLLRSGVKPERMFVSTFTRKASGEMLARIKNRLGSEAIRGMWCGTFHGLCVRLLRALPEDVYRIGRTHEFNISDETRSKAAFRDSVREVLRERFRPEDAKAYEDAYDFKEERSKLSLMKQEGIKPDDLGADREIDQAVWLRYDAKLAAADSFDFDDLLVATALFLESKHAMAWREMFQHVIVDEYQDTNLVQYRIVKVLAMATRNLFVVLDRDQELYAFRGADYRNLLRLREDFKDVREIVIPTNYRSTRNIVEACQGIIEHNQDRIPKVMRTDKAPGPPVVIDEYSDGETEAWNVSEQIRKLVRKEVPLSELAVLYRNRSQSRVFEQQMIQLAIPYRVVGTHRFYDREEVKDTIAWLRTIAYPKSDYDFKRAAQSPPKKLGKKLLDVLDLFSRKRGVSMSEGATAVVAEESDEFTANQREYLRSFIGVCRLRAEELETNRGSLATWVKDTIDRSGLLDYYESHGDKVEREEKPLNIKEVIEAVAAYEKRQRDDGREPTLLGYLDEVACISEQDERKDDGANRVALLTIHAAKGLEFDFVWLVGCEVGRMPSAKAMTLAEIEGERRVMYVACSRAKRSLHVSYAMARTVHGRGFVRCAPSPFLDEIPEANSTWDGDRSNRSLERSDMHQGDDRGSILH